MTYPVEIQELQVTLNKKGVRFPTNYLVEEQKGKRPTMEDSSVHFSIGDLHCYTVFDGHGGSDVSHYLASNLETELTHLLTANIVKYKRHWDENTQTLYTNTMHEIDISQISEAESMPHILRACFYNLQVRIRNEIKEKRRAGSTACVVVIKNGVVTCAYVGDTECHITKNNSFVNMTPFLHHPIEGTPEHERGTKVETDIDIYCIKGKWMIGCLAVCRSFEGYMLDHGEEPTITQFLLDEDCLGIYIGCDGMREGETNTHNPSSICQLIGSNINNEENIPKILVDSAINDNQSKDNVSVMYISLN